MTSPRWLIVLGYLLLKSKSKATGPQRMCILLSGVNEFMGKGCMVRNVAVRKSQEESL